MGKNKGKALAGKEVGGKAKTLTVAEKGVGAKAKAGKQPGKGKRQKLQPESERSDDEADTHEEVEGNDQSDEDEVKKSEKATEEDNTKETEGKQISRKAGKKKSVAEGSNSKGDLETGKSKNISKSDLAQEEDAKDKKRKRKGADREMAEAFLSSDNDFLPLGRRKEVPSFRKVDLSENDYERIVGKRVKVYWSGSRRWFLGRIKSFDNVKKLHKILYEDGDKEEVDLQEERFELEVIPSDGFSLSSNLRMNREKKAIGSSDTEANKESKQDTSSKVHASATDTDTSSSETQPKNEKPVFQKVVLTENDNERIVDKRVKVYWSGSRKWFIGRIKSYDSKKKVHKILYEDGDKENVDLRGERFELEVVPSDNFTAAGKKGAHKSKDDFVIGGVAEQVARPKRGTRKENCGTQTVEKHKSVNSEAAEDEGEESQSGEENTQAGKSETSEDETLNVILKSYKSTRQGKGHKSGN